MSLVTRRLADRAGRWLVGALNLPERITVAMHANWKDTRDRVEEHEERLRRVEDVLICPAFPPEETER